MRYLLLTLIFLATATQAQDLTEHEDVVVTASRTEKKLADSPVATELISREDLANSGAESVATYLQKHPGIHIVPSTFGTRIQMQGLDSKYIIILVDGEKIIGRKYGIMDLSRFTTDNVERIEIVKGNMSALYGSEAIGGVINIITRKADTGHEITLHGRGGEGGQYDAAAAVSLTHNKWTGRVSSDWHIADAFDLDPDDLWTTGNSNEQYSVAANVGYQASETLKISARGDYLHKRAEGVDESGSAILDRRSTTDTQTVGATAQWKMPDYSLTTARVNYTDYRDQFVYDQRGGTGLDDYQDTRQKMGLMGLQHDRYLLDDHYVSVGWEGSYEKLDSERLDGGEGDRTRNALYLQDEWEVSTDQLLILLPGLRMDNDSQFGTHISPKLSLRYDPSQKFVVRASYGLGFRAPDFKELYLLFEHPGVGYRIVGNPELQPETSLSGSLGLEFNPSDSWWLSVSAFRHDVEDLIQAELEPIEDDPLFHWLGKYQNVSSALLQGVDFSARWQAASFLSLDTGYSYLDTEDKDTSEPLEGRAEHTLSASATVNSGPWNFTLRGTWTGERPFSMEGTGYGTEMADAYLLADTQLSRRFDKFKLFVGMNNLLDEGDNDYLPVRPRSAYAGMDLTF
ncbi:MAG: TonB-dependent receptor [bacterium]|nr:TonB-dependent receptor [bacterium]